jgi:pilus assembly protein CpaD
MSRNTTSAFRGFCVAAVILVSGCSVPREDGGFSFEDGARNHPIRVEPSYQSLKLAYSAADQGLSPADAARLDAFVGDYQEHGNGAIAVSAPAGASANQQITFFADRINQMGIARDHILVSTHEAAAGDTRVEIDYVAYQAHADRCGDWSEDLSDTMSNGTPRNFGCAVQQNIAAQIADPRDLMQPRPMEASNAARRTTVVGKYEQGQITQADKRTVDLSTEQSGTSSTK